MKNYIIFIISLLFYSCWTEQKTTEFEITKAIPNNSDLIIKFHDINKINQKIDAFEWWTELQSAPIFNENIALINQLNKIYSIDEIFYDKTIYLSSILIGEKQSEFILITSISDTENKLNKLLQTIHSSDNNRQSYEGVFINNIQIDIDSKGKRNVFFAIYDNIFMLSFSEIIIQESIRQIKSNINLFELDPIHKLDKNLPKYSDLNILVKTPFLEKIIGKQNIFLNSETWSWFDVELETNHIILNGVTNRGNVTYLKDTQYSDSKKSNIENILPRHIKGFYKYQINSTADLNAVINTITGSNENAYHLSYKTWHPTEINVAYNDNSFQHKSYVVFSPNKKSKCLEYMEHHRPVIEDQYLNYEIKKIAVKNFASKDWLKEIVSEWDNIYYIVSQNNMILSDKLKNIKSLINNINSNQTIGKSNALTIINEKLGNKSHTAFYLNFQQHKEKWKKIFNSIVSKNIASEDYFFNSIILLHENMEVQNPTEWIVNLDHETNYKPQFVLNHYTNKLEIFTQDIENNIYLISDKGKVIWKQKIGNSILGDIHQIDRYKNKKLQYLFNSKDSIYLIDRNGKNVEPFPIGSKNEMSIPIAVFDYDKNRNYRILVSMQNELKMYNASGKIISGWEFLKTKSNITMVPEHYQIFNKDYILINEENGKVHLLNRKGQARLIIKDKIQRSNNTMSLIKGENIKDSKLITLNNEGKIIYLYLSGRIDTLKMQNLNPTDQYIRKKDKTIIVRDKTLFFSSKENRFEYEFERKPISQPKLFTNQKSCLIGIRNETENLIYLLNEKGELYGNPFFGTTDFSINQGDHINLIVGSSEGLIYNYKLN